MTFGALLYFTPFAGGSPADWHEFDRSPFKPAPLEISQAIGLLESYFSAKRMSGAAPALQQLRALVEAGDGNAVDRSLSKYEHMKWLEDPAHDLWLVRAVLTRVRFCNIMSRCPMEAVPSTSISGGTTNGSRVMACLRFKRRLQQVQAAVFTARIHSCT